MLRLILLALALCGSTNLLAGQWWKGNLHTHSFWSDGDDFPEMIAKWYHDHGYHFLAISDHNTLGLGEKWISITNQVQKLAFEKYQAAMKEPWVVTRQVNGTNQVRLKTLPEYRARLEKKNRFLLIQAEEITDRYKVFPVHINATHLQEYLPPQGGESVYEVMQRNVDAVLEQRRRTGKPMIPHLNHPNFGWGVMAEDLSKVVGERFFEVYNGHPQVFNEGDSTHASTDQIWDVVLTLRIAQLGLEPLYGLGVDDSHHYHHFSTNRSNSGRGWIMVRSKQLSPESLIEAMEKGDFYATSGVELKEVRRGRGSYKIAIKPEPGVRYRTQFIGTRVGYDSRNEPVRDATGNLVPTTHRYSPDVGAVFKEVEGTKAEYHLDGTEFYVRAKIISTKSKENPGSAGEFETAWTQPLIPE